MSNHSIGYSLNEYFTETIIDLYDNHKLDYESMMEIFESIRSVINCEDGTYEEATECINRCRCGKCMKKMQPQEPLYNLYDIRFCCSDEMKRDIWEIEEKFITGNLCTKCFDEVVNAYEKDSSAGEKYRRYIEEHCDEDEWKAE